MRYLSRLRPVLLEHFISWSTAEPACQPLIGSSEVWQTNENKGCYAYPDWDLWCPNISFSWSIAPAHGPACQPLIGCSELWRTNENKRCMLTKTETCGARTFHFLDPLLQLMGQPASLWLVAQNHGGPIWRHVMLFSASSRLLTGVFYNVVMLNKGHAQIRSGSFNVMSIKKSSYLTIIYSRKH